MHRNIDNRKSLFFFLLVSSHHNYFSQNQKSIVFGNSCYTSIDELKFLQWIILDRNGQKQWVFRQFQTFSVAEMLVHHHKPKLKHLIQASLRKLLQGCEHVSCGIVAICQICSNEISLPQLLSFISRKHTTLKKLPNFPNLITWTN